jgi:glutathione synthase/RimK-type ligase-like ATP-grasp enzyme
MIIAVQPDNYGLNDASSPIWTQVLLELGHEVREINVRLPNIIDQLRGCDGFMWRFSHHPEIRQIARRLLPVIEEQLGIAVYPDRKTSWHYDDKIAQTYLLEAVGLPTPKTWVWFDAEAAAAWARSAKYPIVVKLFAGAGGSNVKLVHNAPSALSLIEQLFSCGVPSFAQSWLLAPGLSRFAKAIKLFIKGVPPDPPLELHKDYVLFQEFLPENSFDTRVTVIGERAFGFRRYNREGDFRASGSGRLDYNPESVDPEFVKLAFDVTKRLNMQSCAIDGLWSDGRPVVAEISYTFASWAIHNCPGHWDRKLSWHEGQMSPEEAQVRDFLSHIEARQRL